MRKRNSFWGILSREVSETPEVVVDRIRQAMLAALDQYGDSESENNQQQDRLEFPLRFATTLEELWYLRPELRQVIARHQDDARTEQVMQDITRLFDGHKHS
jgi:hypothetical protein